MPIHTSGASDRSPADRAAAVARPRRSRSPRRRRTGGSRRGTCRVRRRRWSRTPLTTPSRGRATDRPRSRAASGPPPESPTLQEHREQGADRAESARVCRCRSTRVSGRNRRAHAISTADATAPTSLQATSGARRPRPSAQARDHDQRPHQVELLLDRQRPGVLERATAPRTGRSTSCGRAMNRQFAE